MARKILAGGVMALLLTAQVALAGPRSGARVAVTIKGSSEKVTGELQLVRPGEITIETDRGPDCIIPIKDLSTVRIIRKSALLPGLLLGAAAGGGACYGLSYAEHGHDFLGGITIAAWTVGGVVVGALVGGLGGGFMGKDKIYDLSNLHPSQYPWIVAELQKYARVKSSIGVGPQEFKY